MSALIRAATPADHDALLRINAACWPAVARLDPYELDRLRATGARIAVVCADDEVQGYLILFAHSDPYDGEEFAWLHEHIGEPFLYVDQIAVTPGLRGRGRGASLFAHVLECAHGLGAAVLCCEVNTRPANPESMAFHERLGFTPLGAMATRDGREVALLSRRLPA